VAVAAREVASSARRFRKHLAVYQAGPGVAAVAVGGGVVPIRELGVKFSISYRQVEEVLRSGGKPYFVEVAAAAAELYRVYAPEPYVLFVGPGRRAKLVAVEERTGVM